MASTPPRDPAKAKRHLNADQKRALRAAELADFVNKVGRKKQPRHDPNDRRSDPDFDKALRRVDPMEISKLIADDEPDA